LTAVLLTACGDNGAARAQGSAGCNPLPAACTAAPTCACITANATFACSVTPICSTSGSGIVVSCPNP
jgi:hypothetical protein